MFWQHFLDQIKKNPLLFLLIPLLCGVGAALIAYYQFMLSDPNRNFYYNYNSSINASIGSYVPYAFMEKGGMLDGYTIELTRAIGREMHVRINILSRKLENTQEDAILKGTEVVLCMVKTPSSSKYFDFTSPYATNSFSLLKRKGAPTPENYQAELNNGRFVFNTDGVYYDLHRNSLHNIGVASSAEDALQLMEKGEYDYTILETYLLHSFLPMLYLEHVEPVGEIDERVEYCFAVRKGFPDIFQIFSEGLKKLQETGQFAKIQERWVEKRFLVSQASRNLILTAIFVGMGISLFVLVLFFLWTAMLKREVNERTAELSNEIQERKKTEALLLSSQAQLIQADKLAAIGTLASGVAHEINNPNGLLLLNLKFFQNAFQGMQANGLFAHMDPSIRIAGLDGQELEQEFADALDISLHAARRIGSIVGELRDYARQEPADFAENYVLNDVVSVALRIMDNMIRKCRCNLSTELGENIPPLYGQSQKIEQMLINLIMNACQAMPEPGKALRIQTGHDVSRREAFFRIQDEGTGIAPENLSKLRDPFFTTKRNQGGTGLGLSICDTIVKACHGRMDIESEQGKGTTVTIFLPEARQGSPKEEA